MCCKQRSKTLSKRAFMFSREGRQSKLKIISKINKQLQMVETYSVMQDLTFKILSDVIKYI